MGEMVESIKFWSGKKVLITGHTGFKGGWLSVILNSLKSEVIGIGLQPNTKPSFYESIKLDNLVNSRICDIRNKSEIAKIFNDNKPEIVFHLAAQPLVGLSYTNPFETYETNVLGTLNVLELVKQVGSVKSAVIVTSDKCYENQEWPWGYRETDTLGGHDPYSSSKACTEILTKSYSKSFFYDSETNIATARAGNVIGGGDWCRDRLIPDIYRSIYESKSTIELRNPKAVRPWQHVLDPLFGYMKLAELMYKSNNLDFGGSWNFGPSNSESYSVEKIIDLLQKRIEKEIKTSYSGYNKYKETNFLKLDCSKANNKLKWSPLWDIQKTLDVTTDWYNNFYSDKKNSLDITFHQISNYFSDSSTHK